MDTICQSCDATIDTPYILMGAATICQVCGERTIPKLAVGALRPTDTGYEITFSDFHQLLSYPGYSKNIRTLEDLLRDSELYEQTKRNLAQRSWKYLQNYADAKSYVVEEILARAQNVKTIKKNKV